MPSIEEQQIQTLETTALLPPNAAVQVHTYATISQDEETGNLVVVTQKEKKSWLWTSNSYTWSLATLVLLFLIFSALEYALIKLNLPAMNP